MIRRTGARIVIDARPLSHPQAGGFRTYVRALLVGLRDRADSGDSGEHLVLYVDRPLRPEDHASLPTGAEIRVLDPSRLRSDLLLFGRQVRADAPDAVFGTSNYLPQGLPRGAAQVVTIHDAMGIRAYPWDVGVPRTPRERFINRYWAFLTRQSARRAARMLTVSHGSAGEIAGALGMPAERIRVVYNGLLPTTPETPGARESDTVLVIESPDPRKNAPTAYAAIGAVCERLARPVCLQIVCNGTRALERVTAARSSGLAHPGLRVEPLSELSDAALAQAYGRAAVFVWPSRLEGFGMPPLEAMQQGCAVVSSSAPVMPEILGDIPRYADPDSPATFAAQIAALLERPGERDDRGRRGRAHAATFTCRRMADETAAVWAEALS
jgi:glycosyltransferase involved in cell wall biosynthesis